VLGCESRSSLLLPRNLVQLVRKERTIKLLEENSLGL
jgi:hypothetical protein